MCTVGLWWVGAIAAAVQSEVSTFSEQRAASVSSLTRCGLLRYALLFWSANCPGKPRACCVQGPNGFHRRRTYEKWRVFKWGRFVQLLSDSGCAVIFCAERSLVVVTFYAKLYAHGESLMWNQSKQAHKERVSQARVLRVKFTCCVFYTNGCYMHLHIYIYRYIWIYKNIYIYIPVRVYCFTRWQALFTVYLYICVNMWWKIYLIDISE